VELTVHSRGGGGGEEWLTKQRTSERDDDKSHQANLVRFVASEARQ